MLLSKLNRYNTSSFRFSNSYVFCIELPSCLKISKFDGNLVEILTGELIKMLFSFQASLEGFKTKRVRNYSFLKDESLDMLLKDFIAFSGKVSNLNEKPWSLTLTKTSNLIDDVTKKSRHPLKIIVNNL